MGIPTMNPQIDIESCETVVCSCGSILWDNSFIVKRISPIYASDGQEKFINVPVVVCKKCGNDIRLSIESCKSKIIT
jgi:hypothetical protein